MKKNTFLNRDFLLLSQGQLVNQAGTQIALAATAFWLKQSTDSATLLGLMSAISALPLILLAPLGRRRRGSLVAAQHPDRLRSACAERYRAPWRCCSDRILRTSPW